MQWGGGGVFFKIARVSVDAVRQLEGLFAGHISGNPHHHHEEEDMHGHRGWFTRRS